MCFHILSGNPDNKSRIIITSEKSMRREHSGRKQIEQSSEVNIDDDE